MGLRLKTIKVEGAIVLPNKNGKLVKRNNVMERLSYSKKVSKTDIISKIVSSPKFTNNLKVKMLEVVVSGV